MLVASRSLIEFSNDVVITLIFSSFYVKYRGNCLQIAIPRVVFTFFVMFSASMNSAMLHGYMTVEKGWIAPFNGYQYKATTTSQSWKASQIQCQAEGGDLV